MLEMLASAVTRLGYTITALRSLEEATSVIIENLVDLVICRDNMQPQEHLQGPEALRVMVESRMYTQEVQRPIAPIIRSVDVTTTVAPSELRTQDLASVTGHASTSYETKPSWVAAAKIGRAFSVKMPIDTEPQRKRLAVTIARALGMVKMSGCST